MISQLQQADKELHDDIYVHGIGETEVKGEFRFFGNMMKDGVIWDTAEMTCLRWPLNDACSCFSIFFWERRHATSGILIAFNRLISQDMLGMTPLPPIVSILFSGSEPHQNSVFAISRSIFRPWPGFWLMLPQLMPS